jgi:hypothetical protein
MVGDGVVHVRAREGFNDRMRGSLPLEVMEEGVGLQRRRVGGWGWGN